MPDYLVSWQIEVTADSPEDAAVEAYNMMPHPGSDSTATFLDVLDPEDDSLIEQFDITKLGEVAMKLDDLLTTNLMAWEGEEDSVQREHRKLIRLLQKHTPRLIAIVRHHEALVAALETVLGEADLESADGCDDVQRCVVCRKEYDLDELMDDETETQFQCRNPECAAGKARRLLVEVKQ